MACEVHERKVMAAISSVSSGRLLRGSWNCALLFAVMLMAVHTTATAQNLVGSGDGTMKSVAVGRRILVAPEDTLLRIDWEEVPQMQNDGIYGSVVVSTLNAPKQDLTLIVIAVNEFGKAFVLGYQRIRSEHELRDSFGSRLPAGEYAVHMDAILEVPSSQTVYHAHRHGPQLRVEEN